VAKNEKKTIIVNDVEHNIEDLNEQQIAMVNHIADLDKKLGSLGFNMDQLKVGREAFVNMLTSSLSEDDEATEASH
tara:strand:- start:519 stop:746 length:228 start_codon:yes stop_codon:yes gene_type:complete